MVMYSYTICGYPSESPFEQQVPEPSKSSVMTLEASIGPLQALRRIMDDVGERVCPHGVYEAMVFANVAGKEIRLRYLSQQLATLEDGLRQREKEGKSNDDTRFWSDQDVLYISNEHGITRHKLVSDRVEIAEFFPRDGSTRVLKTFPIVGISIEKLCSSIRLEQLLKG